MDDADGADHRFAWVGGLQGAFEFAGDPQACDREGFLHPFAQRGRGTGVRVVELERQRVELLEGDVVIVVLPRLTRPPLDRVAVGLGGVVENVSLFVLHTALNRDVVAEHLADRRAQRLSALNAVANFEFERLIDRVHGPRRRNRA